jgi:serine/threonine protein kinase/tetratricopeptide (TPR) repeat protein
MAAPKLDEAAIFNAARRIVGPEARQRYVRVACGDDGALADRIEALLRAHDADVTFLAAPAEEVRDLLGASAAEGPDTRVGPYKLQRPIGAGGMGTVFLAEQTEPLQRQVAVKVIRPGMGSHQVLARFEQERQALALMDHPHIAKVLDAGTTENNRPYFVMELIDGVPLIKYCDRARLSVRQRLELFVPVCQAVQHAHQKGIIHRDLKPSNVLVTLYDGKAVPKVIDFGIAKATGQKLTERALETQVGSVVGTLEYMSPEQAEPGQPDVDTRSDIYSLGVLLYELLTGGTPLRAERLRGVALLDALRAVREEEPARPSTRLDTTEELPTVAANRGTEPRRLVGLVRGELDWIVMKCLEKDRARRYESADALARDLGRYLNLEPVEACPPSASYRLRKFARRNRKLLLAAGAFVLLLTAGVVASAWQAVRATAAEGQALAARDGEAEQRRRAEKSAAESAAVLKFFRDRVLAAARPKGEEGGLGKGATIREALDNAEPKIAGAFTDQPLVEASIRHTLAQSYSHLGVLDRAVTQQRRAVELYRRELGGEHASTLGARNNLAIMLQAQGQSEAALAQFEELVPLEERVLGPEDTLTLRTTNNLANVLWSLNRLAEARAVYEKALATQRRALGPHNIDTLRSMNNLANVLWKQRHLNEARKLYEETLDLERRFLPPEHPHTLGTLNNLANVLNDQGKTAEAIKLYEEALQKQRQALPRAHPAVLITMNNLANSLLAHGRLEGSRKLFEETLRLQRGALPAGHPEMLRTMINLAWLLATTADAKVRDPKRALELAQEAVKHAPGPGSKWTALGVAHYRLGDWKNAVGALEKHPPRTDETVRCLNDLYLAMAYWKLGEKDKARRHYGRAAEWMEKTHPTDQDLLRDKAEAAQLLGPPPADPPGKKDGQ